MGRGDIEKLLELDGLKIFLKKGFSIISKKPGCPGFHVYSIFPKRIIKNKSTPEPKK